MKKLNPVLVFGLMAVAILLFIIVWCVIDVGSAHNVTLEKHTVVPDSLPCFLVLSDIHLHQSVNQDKITFWHATDSGDDLWDTAQNKIRNVLSGKSGFTIPKFIIVLGDLPWHAKEEDRDELESAHKSSGKVLTDLRRLSESTHIPLLYVPGNNDPWDGDYGRFSTKIFGEDKDGESMWPLIAPVSTDTNGVQATIIDKSKLGLGCYSAYPLGKNGKLRVIALNTTMFVHHYADTANQQVEVNAQMQWFAGQLADAAAGSEYVLITMHVPPGLDGYKKKDFWRRSLGFENTRLQNAFIDLLDKYQDRVIGVLSSHTHMDGLRKIFNKADKLVAIDISVPAISPGHGNNPAFKLISYNASNFELQNFITLYDRFFPGKKVVSWVDDAFDFRGEFGCPQGKSILKCLDTLNNVTLQNGIQDIYKVKNGRGKAGEVDTAINVKYELAH